MNWNDRVRLARQADLAQWLRRNNEPLKRIGKWWYIEGFDSLRIQGNMWYRNSQSRGGNSIDFLVAHYRLSPKEAIERLTQDVECCLLTKKSGVKEKNEKTHAGFDFNAVEMACDQRRVLAYLSKTRGIPADLLLAEIQDRQLFQESGTGNAIFAMTNEAGDIVGAEVVGTLSFENARFKCVKAGSATSYGYNFGQKHDPHYILFFESAVDLLSFVAISRSRAKPMTGCLLVSMAGLKSEVVRKSLRVFGNSAAIPVLCVDNDDAGSNFIASCLNLYAAAIIKQPDKNSKDWNDQLRGNSISSS